MLALKKCDVVELTKDEMIDIDGGQVIAAIAYVVIWWIINPIIIAKRLEAFIDGLL